jgi:hypothetical protein
MSSAFFGIVSSCETFSEAMKMRPLLISTVCAIWVTFAQGEPGVISPLAEKCGPSSGNIVCVNKYGAVMPYHFFRNVSSNDDKIPYGGTEVSADKSFSKVASADFLVFDKARGLALLGSKPSYSFVFNVSNAVHEAPVYVPVQNKLYISQLAPPAGYLPQLIVDLNNDPPTLSTFISDPPVYAPNGGTFHDGKVVWGGIRRQRFDRRGRAASGLSHHGPSDEQDNNST